MKHCDYKNGLIFNTKDDPVSRPPPDAEVELTEFARMYVVFACKSAAAGHLAERIDRRVDRLVPLSGLIRITIVSPPREVLLNVLLSWSSDSNFKHEHFNPLSAEL